MRTKLCFTINWNYVAIGLSLLWGSWVTVGLYNAEQRHNEIDRAIEILDGRLLQLEHPSHSHIPL